MNNTELYRVMEILRPHVDVAGNNFQCEHDEMFFCVDVEDINATDLAELYRLGCKPGNQGDGLRAAISC